MFPISSKRFASSINVSKRIVFGGVPYESTPVNVARLPDMESIEQRSNGASVQIVSARRVSLSRLRGIFPKSGRCNPPPNDVFTRAANVCRARETSTSLSDRIERAFGPIATNLREGFGWGDRGPSQRSQHSRTTLLTARAPSLDSPRCPTRTLRRPTRASRRSNNPRSTWLQRSSQDPSLRQVRPLNRQPLFPLRVVSCISRRVCIYRELTLARLVSKCRTKFRSCSVFSPLASCSTPCPSASLCFCSPFF